MSAGDKGPSQASQLVSMAKAGYEFVMSTDGRPYGVRRNGPNVARPFKGRGGVRAALAKQFTEDNGGQVPSASALADAMNVLEGIADATDPVRVHLRVARDGERIVLDLGTADGKAVIVTANGWTLADRSPILFRRSGAMMPLPTPEQGGDGIALLRDLVNMDDSAFHRLVAWLVAAWLPDIPHPVLTFKGEQGTGKSYTAQMIVNLADPSPAAKRSQPRDVKAWSVQAFNSWALCLDNVSAIPPWLSDTLCRAVTGDGIVDRALYSDDDVVVLTFRRVLAMTTIDAGALAGDLAERMMLLDLQPIPKSARRGEEEMDAAYAAARPTVIGSLLDLLASVLRELPDVTLESKPRLADFARVLAAIDRVTGWSTFADYDESAESVNADALEGDPFGSALVAFLDTQGPWCGTAAQLMDVIPPPDGYHPQWPKDATRASGRLKRIAPLLRSIGIAYDDTQRTSDRARQRLIRLTPSEMRCGTASAASAASATPADLHEPADTRPDADRAAASAQRPHDDHADAVPAPADARDPSASALASATDTAPDLHSHKIPDAADAADAAIHRTSNPGLRCPVCEQPMDPELTAAGHLTHPDC
ncbi:ATP-binding protein [Streptomyces sp. S1A1-8]|uniref:ATP-binding protein n=1 Tax=unclassified Streptomyces TaxID=2593676 RepID=UPI00116257D3|nr:MULTISPECIES: ATP-binding protein [unclassified Streptomyces]QDO00782.1 ATP-binding protein [Streptomyces sp. RLB1-9]QDO22512.1 ATP-binding protein [Streptomyces sp. S1A1-8]QDO32639.1 ATP-binding protein [Streptomyces sp. S1A1-3]